MKIEVKDGMLIVSLPLETPKSSASGKTLVVASTRGNIATTATVGGKIIYLGLNAYVRRD